MRFAVSAVFLLQFVACTTASTGESDVMIAADALSDTWTSPFADSTQAQDTAPRPFDVGDPNPGETGYPCESNEDCDSGYCIEGPDGYICTELCDEQCRPASHARGINSGSGDVVFICVPPPPNKASLCEPWSPLDLPGRGAACIAIDDGNFCGKACEDASDCSDGYVCEAVEGIQMPQCIPATGSCQCKDLNLGLARTCTVEATGEAPKPAWCSLHWSSGVHRRWVERM